MKVGIAVAVGGGVGVISTTGVGSARQPINNNDMRMISHVGRVSLPGKKRERNPALLKVHFLDMLRLGVSPAALIVSSLQPESVARTRPIFRFEIK